MEMKECDKGKSHISSKRYMIFIPHNNAIKTFTPLHYASPNYTSLHVTTLFDTSLPFI